MEEMILTTAEEIKAFSVPYRIQILNIFESLGRAATVKEIADMMKEVPANVHYHVKVLEKFNILKLDHTKEINGIIAKYYEPTAQKYTITASKVGDVVSEAINQQKVRMIEGIFENGKSIFVKEMSTAKDSDKSKDKGIISLADVYITKAEFVDLRKLVEEFCREHKKPEGADALKEKYNLLFSIVRIED